MVIIRNLVSSLKKAESKPWLEGFSKVPSSTVLIFADSVTPAALEKSEIFKVLHDQPDVHTYSLPQLEGGELTSWSAARAKFHGVNISSSVLASLLARTGNDSWRIDAEPQKLGAYAAHEPVTPAMVTALVRVESDEDIFAFMDALASGQAVKTLQKLSEERAAGADAFQLFGMLARQIRLLLQARAILDLNPKAQKQDLADGLSIHPFVAQKLLTEVRSWSAEKLESLHGLAFKLDKSMKTGLDPDISVDRLVTSFLLRFLDVFRVLRYCSRTYICFSPQTPGSLGGPPPLLCQISKMPKRPCVRALRAGRNKLMNERIEFHAPQLPQVAR